MARQYTSEEIAVATKALEENGGDISLISTLLGIPERTLYTWRKKYLKTSKKSYSPPPLLPPAPETPQQPLHPNPFGMTHEDLQKALETEYVPHPYNDLRQALMADIVKLQPTIAEDPNLAHVRALAVSRMIDDVLRLEAICRVEKPQLTIFKYEYHDGTLHDVPPWSHAIHQRAMRAYEAVIAAAKRQYEEQLANPSDELPADSNSLAEGDEPDWDAPAPTLEELLAERFKPEDFNPRHTGIHKYLLEDRYKRQQGINESQPKAQDD
jgi:hypothetical protein